MLIDDGAGVGRFQILHCFVHLLARLYIPFGSLALFPSLFPPFFLYFSSFLNEDPFPLSLFLSPALSAIQYL